tara:strand:+ start:109 stop:540 length:432 start_codon:yes stop_codon:yes gene_type:complete
MSKFFIFILILFLLISCNSEKSGARLSLENYLISLKNEEFQNAYSVLSNQVKENCKFDNFQKRASDNYDAIKYSRLIYSGENKSENTIRVNFMIKIDDDEVNLFDMQILDPYIDEEVAKFIFEEEKWVLDNLIWPIDLCEEMK